MTKSDSCDVRHDCEAKCSSNYAEKEERKKETRTGGAGMKGERWGVSKEKKG